MAGRLKMALFGMIMAAFLVHVSQAQTTHTVGDSLGWIIPPGANAYSSWAANQTFMVGDVLVFNFAAGGHDVGEVTQADYDACNTTSPISLTTTSPARIILNSAGAHYFICNFTGHCSAGQKLAVNVTASTASPAPQPASPATSPAPEPSAATTPAPQPASPSATPVSAPSPAPVSATPPTPVSAPSPAPVSATPPTPVSAPSPSPSSQNQRTHIVGDTTGWVVPSGGAAFYSTWAAGKTFSVGDFLVFNYANGQHDVAEVTSANFGSCSGTSPISLNSTAPSIITLTSAGQHYYICTVPGHCTAGQQLAINVSGTATAPSPSTTSPPSPTVPSAQSPSGVATPPTPANSATSLGVASLFVTFFSVLVALMY